MSKYLFIFLSLIQNVNYLFIEFTENVLYRDMYRYRDMK